MYKVIAFPHIATLSLASAPVDLKTFIENHYEQVLSEARCPCTGDKKPCPSLKDEWSALVSSPSIDQSDLKFALYGLEGAIETNSTLIKSDATSLSRITNFLAKVDGYKEIDAEVKNAIQGCKQHLE